MKVGVISDTHDNLASIEKAMIIFQSERVDLIVHCGDWNQPEALLYLAQEADKASIPIKGVFGNNDKRLNELLEHNSKLSSPVEFALNKVLEFEYGNKKFAVYHGDNKKILDDLIESRHYDVVLTGHTHKARKEFTKGTLVINPGSTAFQIPRVKGNGLTSVAVYDTSTTTSQIIYLN
jgi:putative phosphoesterase